MPDRNLTPEEYKFIVRAQFRPTEVTRIKGGCGLHVRGFLHTDPGLTQDEITSRHEDHLLIGLQMWALENSRYELEVEPEFILQNLSDARVAVREQRPGLYDVSFMTTNPDDFYPSPRT